MTDAAQNPDDYCYRHPERLSFVLCERCARTICLECQTQANGHVLCPDDAQARVTQMSTARAARAKRLRRTRPRVLDRISPDTPIVTYSIVVALIVVFLADTFARGALTLHLSVFPSDVAPASNVDVLHQPWALLTSMILAGGIIGLLFNGYSIFILGRQLERIFGREKFFALYVVSGFGASVFAFLLDGWVTSAIGAVFGLVGATVIMARRMGGNQILLYVTCAVSLVFAIIFGSWQAAIGGGLAGAAITLTYFYEDTRRQNRSRLLLVAIVGVLLVLAIVRAFAFQA